MSDKLLAPNSRCPMCGYYEPFNTDRPFKCPHQKCHDQVFQLERSLAGLQDKYDKLKETYDKLSDIWNAFQGSMKPDPRYVYRAEAQGQMARKLSQVLVGIVHETCGLRALAEVLLELVDEEAATVEVSEKLVPRRG